LDERAAVERLKRGDVGGLEALVRKYHTRAGRAAFLIVRDHSLAEDVAQGAFVRAYERIGGFDAERPFGPWFMKIVVNNAVEAARRRERTTSYEKASVGTPMTWLVDPTAGPQEEAEEAEERQRVWTALEKLPPSQRAAVVQRYYLGMSEAEMSEGGGSPPGTIKSRLYAARRRLSKLLRSQVGAGDAPESGERATPTGAPSYRSEEGRP
jgi:RNA polymerase sigma-70 factor (ECF subfamily)